MDGKAMLLSLPEAAKVLGIGKNIMYDLVHAGHINVLKIGGAKIPRYELERFARESINKDFTYLNNVKEMKGWA